MCSTCQQSCPSAWALIQHVQQNHGVKICSLDSSILSTKLMSPAPLPPASTASPFIPNPVGTPTNHNHHHHNSGSGNNHELLSNKRRERSNDRSERSHSRASISSTASSSVLHSVNVPVMSTNSVNNHPLTLPPIGPRSASAGPFGPNSTDFGLLRFPFPQPFCLPRPPSTTSSHDFRAVEQLVSPSTNNVGPGSSNRLAPELGLINPFLPPPVTSSTANSFTNSLSSSSQSVSLSNLLLDHHLPHHHGNQHSLHSSITNNSASTNNSATSVSAEHLSLNQIHPHHHPLFLHSDFRPLPNLPFDPRTALDLATAAAAAAAAVSRHSNNPSGSEPLDFYSQRLRQLAGGSSVSPSPGSPGFARKPAMTPPSPLSPEDGEHDIIISSLVH